MAARQYFGGGFTGFGLIPGRPDDSFGFGLAWTWLNRDPNAARFFFHDTPREMGGTMVLPGSHLRRINEAAIARYQNFVGQQAMACPAGSLLICHHGVWHCGQPNRTDRART